MPRPLGFLSYAKVNDVQTDGRVSELREVLEAEVRNHGVADFELFQDKDTAGGAEWERAILAKVDTAVHFIPVLTPTFFSRPWCQREIDRFLARPELAAGRAVVYPLYFINDPEFDDEDWRAEDPRRVALHRYQFRDVRPNRVHGYRTGAGRVALAECGREIAHQLILLRKQEEAWARAAGHLAERRFVEAAKELRKGKLVEVAAVCERVGGMVAAGQWGPAAEAAQEVSGADPVWLNVAADLAARGSAAHLPRGTVPHGTATPDRPSPTLGRPPVPPGPGDDADEITVRSPVSAPSSRQGTGDRAPGPRPAGVAPAPPRTAPPPVAVEEREEPTVLAPSRPSARSPQPGQVPHTALSDLAPLRLAYIPAGTFQMGSPDGVGAGDEHPRHPVRITRPFVAGVTPVTQSQWRAVAKAARLPESPSHFKGDTHPVESVSWFDAVRWCNALSVAENRPAAYTIGAGHTPEVKVDLTTPGYRLPTEAEWEYLCRAGTETRWSFGDDEAALGDHAWFGGNAGGTHPVGKKRPNPWGLHDVHGNVWEWCGDKAYPTYTEEPIDDPFLPPAVGDGRVIRGGSWNNTPDGCRSAYRNDGGPGDRLTNQGFRVVLPLPRA